MIIKAENILGGTVLTMSFVEEPSKTDGAIILTIEQARHFCEAIDNRVRFEIADELSLFWYKDQSMFTLLIHASSSECSGVVMDDLAKYMRSRDCKPWKFGGVLVVKKAIQPNPLAWMNNPGCRRYIEAMGAGLLRSHDKLQACIFLVMQSCGEEPVYIMIGKASDEDFQKHILQIQRGKIPKELNANTIDD